MYQLNYWLRWLAVLPGALLGSVLLTFLLHWILDNTLINFMAPYPELPARILSPLVIAAGVVWLGRAASVVLGAILAPGAKWEKNVPLDHIQMSCGPTRNRGGLSLFGPVVRATVQCRYDCKLRGKYGDTPDERPASVGVVSGALVIEERRR
jgi:hypothetical protein